MPWDAPWRQAEDDLAAARLLRDGGHSAQAVVLRQQAAQKAIHAAPHAAGRPAAPDHDLNLLSDGVFGAVPATPADKAALPAGARRDGVLPHQRAADQRAG